MTGVLYLSYNGLLEPILSSQAIPYLKELAKRDFRFTLLTYEKKKDLRRVGKEKIKALKDELGSHGIEWRYLCYHKTPAVFSTLYDLLVGTFYCAYLVLNKKIKIVHVRGITPGSITIFLSRIFKLKILFDMRGLLAEEMAAGGLWKKESIQFNLIKKCEKGLLQRADAVTVLTNKHLELNRRLSYLKDRHIPMDMIPCCVDMDRFNYMDTDSADLKETLGLKSRFILMYPGKTGAFYLIDKMLEFFKVMLKIIPDAVFFILTTDDIARITELARATGIKEDRVIVKKDVPFESIPKYLSIADAGLFFINSYDKLGSSPIKLGEFLASGVPVIINSGVGDSDDIVRENGAGVIVTGFDDANYRKAIYELLRLKKSGEALRKKCRDTAGRYLSLAVGVDKYYKIYKVLS